MNRKGRKTEYARLAGFWRLCMVLFFCLLPLQASALACDGARMAVPHHDIVMTDTGGHDNNRHLHTQNTMPLCCAVCVSVPFVTVDAELASFIPVKHWYSAPMQVLTGIKPPPLLQPPLFS